MLSRSTTSALISFGLSAEHDPSRDFVLQGKQVVIVIVNRSAHRMAAVSVSLS